MGDEDGIQGKGGEGRAGSWKAHLFPLSVAMPALVIVVVSAALVLGMAWTALNSIMVSAVIALGILLELLASKRIAELRFARPPKTG